MSCEGRKGEELTLYVASKTADTGLQGEKRDRGIVNELTEAFYEIQQFLKNNNVGNVNFKGVVKINDWEIPVNTQVNIIKGSIGNVNVSISIMGKKRR